MTTEPTFDQARAELESIVTRLESGAVGLDEALELWARGEELYRLCTGKLDAAQGRVEELLLDGEATGGASDGQSPDVG
ncbi:MAG: exodeoxyribonuclease VII small subunit [Gaiellales bacterium]